MGRFFRGKGVLKTEYTREMGGGGGGGAGMTRYVRVCVRGAGPPQTLPPKKTPVMGGADISPAINVSMLKVLTLGWGGGV